MSEKPGEGIIVEIDLSGDLLEKLEELVELGGHGDTIEAVASKMLNDGMRAQMRHDLFAVWDELTSAGKFLMSRLQSFNLDNFSDPVAFIIDGTELTEQIRAFNKFLVEK